MKSIHKHFSKIAHKYGDLRTGDLEPILFIKKKVQNLTKIEAGDIGCGMGRYDIKLFKYLGERLHLTCIDMNDDMLNELTKNFNNENIVKNFKIIKSLAENLPLQTNSLDYIFTFNTIHHFKLINFLKETSRILRNNGYLFIYTRLKSQNKRNIWGRFFPKFYEKETRLYELNELIELFKKTPILRLESIEYFKYKRKAKLERLLALAVNHHYSTFCLYNKKEFEKALKEFQKNIVRNFKNTDRITWNDENIMFFITKNKGHEQKI
ncbi:MAG: class I SAM-dependent methyltransferase [bacterium]